MLDDKKHQSRKWGGAIRERDPKSQTERS